MSHAVTLFSLVCHVPDAPLVSTLFCLFPSLSVCAFILLHLLIMFFIYWAPALTLPLMIFLSLLNDYCLCSNVDFSGSLWPNKLTCCISFLTLKCLARSWLLENGLGQCFVSHENLRDCA